jgi:hypothetical protein
MTQTDLEKRLVHSHQKLNGDRTIQDAIALTLKTATFPTVSQRHSIALYRNTAKLEIQWKGQAYNLGTLLELGGAHRDEENDTYSFITNLNRRHTVDIPELQLVKPLADETLNLVNSLDNRNIHLFTERMRKYLNTAEQVDDAVRSYSKDLRAFFQGQGYFVARGPRALEYA